MSDDDPCKDCIEKAEPVTPEPVEISLSHWAITSPALHQTLVEYFSIEADEPFRREASALLRWAIEESQKGRVILSGDPERGGLQRLDMPVLHRAFSVRNRN